MAPGFTTVRATLMPVAEFPERRFPPPWTVEELDACLSATTADRHSPMYITGMSRDGERG